MTRPHVLVVGVGSIGERHLRCFLATGRAEVSLCEELPQRRLDVAARYPVRAAYASLDQAEAGSPIDAVVVATPAHLHVPIALRCLRVGCHLLIEKPLAVEWPHAHLLLQETRQRPQVVAVGYVYRAHPALAAMRQAIRSGRFGEPLQVVAQCGQHFPFYRPAYRDSYYRDRTTGGGAVQDALTHVLNAAEWLVGPIDRLVADLAHLALPGVEVEDTVHVLTRQAGILGCFSLNQHQAPNEVTLSVVGQKGTARFEYHRHRWCWQTTPDGNWQEEALPLLERDTLFIRQANQFLDALEGNGAPLCTVEEAAQTLAVNLAVLRSAQSLSWENVHGF